MNMHNFRKCFLFFLVLSFSSVCIGKDNSPAPGDNDQISGACASALIKANHHVTNGVYDLFKSHIVSGQPIQVAEQKAFGGDLYDSAGPLMDTIIRECPKSVVKELQSGLPI